MRNKKENLANSPAELTSCNELFFVFTWRTFCTKKLKKELFFVFTWRTFYTFFFKKELFLCSPEEHFAQNKKDLPPPILRDEIPCLSVVCTIQLPETERDKKRRKEIWKKKETNKNKIPALWSNWPGPGSTVSTSLAPCNECKEGCSTVMLKVGWLG